MTGKNNDNDIKDNTDNIVTEAKQDSSQETTTQKATTPNKQSSDKNQESNQTTETKAEKPAKATPEKASKPSTSADNSSTSKSLPEAKNSKGIWAVLQTVLLLIIAIGLLVGAYFGWQFWSVQNSRIQALEATASEQDTQYTQLKRQQGSLSSLTQSLQEQQQQSQAAVTSALNNEQKATQQRLDAHAEQLERLSGTNSKAWMLDEARYLLRLANQRQLTHSDPTGIIGLLKSADAILRGVDDPQLFPVRDRINKEMVALKLAPVIDREGLYLQLSALIEQVDQLPAAPLNPFTKEADSTTNVASSSSETTVWYKNVWASIRQASNNFIEKAIRIDDHSQPVKPLLSGLQQSVMRQNLRLMLEQAQIALLREEKVIYQQSLDKVVHWLNTHYDHYDEKAAMVEQVTELQRQRIVGALPDISRSLSLLVEHIERYNTPKPQKLEQSIPENSLSVPQENKEETAL